MVPMRFLRLDNTLAWTKTGLSAIGSALQSLEIGNEPDLADWYTSESYATHFDEFSRQISSAHPELTQPIIQALDVSYAGGGNTNNSPHSLIDSHGLNTHNVSQLAYHYYGKDLVDDTLPNLQRSIANHTYLLHGGCSGGVCYNGLDVYPSYIQYATSHGLPFIFSECGADGGESTGDPKIKRRNNMVMAMWNTDFMLQAMTMGATRVNMQTAESFPFSLWQPGPSKWSDDKAVRAAYYALPLVADFIGTSGETRAVALGSHNDGKLAAYAAYDAGVLARVVVLNTELWVPANGTRVPAQIQLSGVPSTVKSAKIHFLSADEGAYDQFPTWHGLRWTAASDGKQEPAKNDSVLVPISGGRLTMSIDPTAVAMIEF